MVVVLWDGSECFLATGDGDVTSNLLFRCQLSICKAIKVGFWCLLGLKWISY